MWSLTSLVEHNRLWSVRVDFKSLYFCVRDIDLDRFYLEWNSWCMRGCCSSSCWGEFQTGLTVVGWRTLLNTLCNSWNLRTFAFHFLNFGGIFLVLWATLCNTGIHFHTFGSLRVLKNLWSLLVSVEDAIFVFFAPIVSGKFSPERKKQHCWSLFLHRK